MYLLKLSFHSSTIYRLHYLQATGAKRFIFVAVEKIFPYSVGIYELSPHFIERGYELQEQTLSDIKQAQESGIWKGYTNYEPEGIKTLTPLNGYDIY